MTARLLVLALVALLPLAPRASAAVVCTVLVDAGTGGTVMRKGDCGRRYSPASSFKVPISLMGYDAGILIDESTPAMPFREGYADWMPSWRTTTTPEHWMRESVVWYSQQITQSLGEDRFRRYLALFSYGNQDASGTPGKSDGLTRSWLGSSLAISPDEQVAFLRRLVNRDLGIAPLAYDMTTRLLATGTTVDGWTVYGKTGSGSPRRADGGPDRARSFGWYVGWISRGDRTIVFARLIQDRQRQADYPGPRARASFLRDLPAMLGKL